MSKSSCKNRGFSVFPLLAALVFIMGLAGCAKKDSFHDAENNLTPTAAATLSLPNATGIPKTEIASETVTPSVFPEKAPVDISEEITPAPEFPVPSPMPTPAPTPDPPPDLTPDPTPDSASQPASPSNPPPAQDIVSTVDSNITPEPSIFQSPKPTEKLLPLFVGSKVSDKFHVPACRYVKNILAENEMWFDTFQDAEKKGYIPCKVCNPQ